MAGTDFISTAEVARRKGCTGMAVRNAIQRGDLNGRKLGPVWAVADDESLAAWQVKETGGRTHRQNRDAEIANEEA
ncbi:hypothetical protein B1759_14265 [Rubrivirga sp. SAORIC476]|uniref:hypothetical protein n=1 Tax=Rubrivirga sp. SAORIC476 TaxID=1961794 RepID=UPI000BA9C15D|nr:hypothetical protein [Rubrivirga sp. SAORIC476]PAP79484.1 hypothetical protein B1759_14265 [Rubrivirga sp. SAORIC476]